MQSLSRSLLTLMNIISNPLLFLGACVSQLVMCSSPLGVGGREGGREGGEGVDGRGERGEGGEERRGEEREEGGEGRGERDGCFTHCVRC